MWGRHSRHSGNGARIIGILCVLLFLLPASLGAWVFAPVKSDAIEVTPIPTVERIVVMPDESQKATLQNEINSLLLLVKQLRAQLAEQETWLAGLKQASGTTLTDSMKLSAEIENLKTLLAISNADYATLKGDYDRLVTSYNTLDADFAILAQKYDTKALEATKYKAKANQGHIIVGADALYQSGQYGVGGTLGIRLVGGLTLNGGVEWMVGQSANDLRYRLGLSYII